MTSMTPGFSLSMLSALMMPRVPLLSGTWTVITSAFSMIVSRSTMVTLCRAACSVVTKGSQPMTFISRPRARSATAMPILPRPMMPRVRPRSSTPVKELRFHSPFRSDASAAAVLWARASMSVIVCSAAETVLPVGALTTTMPALVAASRSTLSTPTPARPMTIIRVALAMMSAVTLTWLRTNRAS